MGYQAGVGLALPLGGASFMFEPRYVHLSNVYFNRSYIVPVFFGMRFQY